MVLLLLALLEQLLLGELGLDGRLPLVHLVLDLLYFPHLLRRLWFERDLDALTAGAVPHIYIHARAFWVGFFLGVARSVVREALRLRSPCHDALEIAGHRVR